MKWAAGSFSLVFTAAIVVCAGCASRGSPAPRTTWVAQRAAALDAGVPAIIRSRRIAGVGVALIRDGRLAWTGYYGEQGPGVPASRTTMFNTASLAKSITAETAVRLASAGMLSLDEPIAAWYLEPDLADDPRYARLTPRIILSHRSGLLNWEYQYKNKKLAFVADPGTRFGYSGAAYDILAKFLEKKSGLGFEELVSKTVFEPLGMTHTSMRRRASIDALVTTPMNADGVYEAPYTTTQRDWHHGSWSSASDLFVTLEDYSKFLIDVMKGHAVSMALARERFVVESSFAGAEEWACMAEAGLVCPNPYGFGLGWIVFDYGPHKLVWGGGNDSGENALVHFSPDKPGDAVVIFINGGNGVVASLDIAELIDRDQLLVSYLHQLVDRHRRQ